jgi:hypothetical protein
VRFENLPFPYLVLPAQLFFNASSIMVCAVPMLRRSGAKTQERFGLSLGGSGRAAEIGETLGETTLPTSSPRGMESARDSVGKWLQVTGCDRKAL